ncbi:deoxyribonuclease IV [Parachlamydia acanthamoebae]|jgi:deoxyribonuclease-4|uniref:Probable endonuclease 4 n=2 Tax=Parachlamydia acanthamoebae TaxID=83552 RepID=F8KYX2_PARAV|nr:deoxyribonuclease IV [Parachlamydia acanthamoebae]CCB86091.1 putative endonuclease 4 [Parachlamydia acanthamoebae UV-7]
MRTEKLLLGAHTSAAGGAQNALLEGKRIGATTIQLFTSNQKRWQGKILGGEEIKAWEKALDETGLEQIMSHDSYLINLGSSNPELLEKSRKAFREEATRCHQLGISYLNFHPGAAVEATEQQCLDRICESLLGMQDLLENRKTRLLLEATAGQGSAVGWRFEHLAYIIDKVQHKLPIGVCIDTCHIFAAGYDIRTSAAWDATLEEFNRVVGLKHLYAFHVNDSAKGLGTRVDRHQPLGKGLIGIESFQFLMTDLRTKHLPKYLETPGGPELWEVEIQMLQDFTKK